MRRGVRPQRLSTDALRNGGAASDDARASRVVSAAARPSTRRPPPAPRTAHLGEARSERGHVGGVVHVAERRADAHGDAGGADRPHLADTRVVARPADAAEDDGRRRARQDEQHVPAPSSPRPPSSGTGGASRPHATPVRGEEDTTPPCAAKAEHSRLKLARASRVPTADRKLPHTIPRAAVRLFAESRARTRRRRTRRRLRDRRTHSRRRCARIRTRSRSRPRAARACRSQ